MIKTMTLENEHLTKCLDRCDVLNRRISELELRLMLSQKALEMHDRIENRTYEKLDSAERRIAGMEAKSKQDNEAMSKLIDDATRINGELQSRVAELEAGIKQAMTDLIETGNCYELLSGLVYGGEE